MTNRDLVDEFAIVDEFTRRYYFPKVIAGLMNIDEAMIEEASEKVALRIREGRRIFGFGNGGSEAISDAFIYALEQRISPAFQFDTYSNPKLPEVTDSPNSKLFHHRILRSGRKGDLAVLISASGNSNNINEISRLCRQKGVETVSVSGDGRITNNPKTKAGLPIVIPLEDQQTLEDVTLGVVYLISELVQYKIEGKKYDVSKIKRQYVDNFIDGFEQLSTQDIHHLATTIVRVYQEGSNHIRIDAPDNGLLSLNAEHMHHNLKWDAFQNIKLRFPNRVSSGFITTHISGVANDGGEFFNYALEIEDNARPGDVEVLFVKNKQAKQVQALLNACKRAKVEVHTFSFNTNNEYVASNLAQSALHLTARVINTYLICDQDRSRYFSSDLLRNDLALLRQKEHTRKKLEGMYHG